MTGGSVSATVDTPAVVEVAGRERVRVLAGTVATVGAPLLVVAGLALANGGSEPTQWGWASLLLLWVGATGILLTRLELGWLDVMFLGGLLALLGWVAASLLWTNDVSHTLDEIERVVVYPAAAIAALGLGSRRGLPQITAGVWAGGVIACGYALTTRLFPSRFGEFDSVEHSYRLTDPFPYWNMLAGLAGLTLVVALGLAIRSRPVWLRCAAAASLPVLALTLYFTYSRGAMAATAVALLVVLALDPARARFAAEGIVLGVVPAAAVYAASHRDGLTRRGVDLAAATSDGRTIAALTLGLAGVAVLLTLLLVLAERRLRPSDDLRTALTVLLFGGLVALAVAATIPRGGPIAATSDVYHSFKGAPIGTEEGASLNGRLLDASSNGRTELWSVARDEWRDHPLVGGGGGTFTAEFYARGDRTFDTENAHSLYLETLAELGVVGELLVLLVILTPFVAGVRARREPLAAAALGGYTVMVVQAAVDTDWESPAVVVPAILLGGAVIAAARGRRLPAGPLGRGILVGAAVVLAALSGYALSANRAIDQAAAASETNPCLAIRDAKHATDRMPWSARSWQALAGAYIERRPARAGPARVRAGAPAGADRLPPLVRVRRGAEHRRRRGRVPAGAPRSTRSCRRPARSSRSTRPSSPGSAADGAHRPAREPRGGRAARLRVRRLPARRRRRRPRTSRRPRSSARSATAARTTPARATRPRGWSASRAARSTSTTGARRWPRPSRPCRRWPPTRSRTGRSSGSRWPPPSAASTRASAS